MKVEWKSCFKVGLSVFIVYILIIYWSTFSALLAKFFGALVPLVVGFVIA